ncbi:MAG: hypothetical protein NZM12_00960 [Steroidobacteraceae bacterium]|nr:hypothetical protein [Steroidobacteraceae bacterium]
MPWTDNAFLQVPPVAATLNENMQWLKQQVDALQGAAGLTNVAAMPSRVMQTINANETLLPANAALGLGIVSNAVTLFLRSVTVAGSGNVTVNLPTVAQGAALGLAFEVRNGSSGTLTIQAPSGSTINAASSVTVPYANGLVWIEVESISGQNVTWRAIGDLGSGIDLPTINAKGDLFISGRTKTGKVFVGDDISGNYTLVDADAGSTRWKTDAGTVTVPTTFRGVFRLINAHTAAVTISFASGGSYSVPAGQAALVEVVERGASVVRMVWPLSFVTPS